MGRKFVVWSWPPHKLIGWNNLGLVPKTEVDPDSSVVPDLGRPQPLMKLCISHKEEYQPNYTQGWCQCFTLKCIIISIHSISIKPEQELWFHLCYFLLFIAISMCLFSVCLINS